MMKKLLLVLGILVFVMNAASARSMPRWAAFPLSVYLPPDVQESAIVRSAFENWKSNSKYILRFIYKKSNVARRTSDINVYFYDKLPGDEAYTIREKYAGRYYAHSEESRGFFYHVDINIALNDKEGKRYSRQELSAISLQAIGRALGIPCQSGDYGAMVCDQKYNVYSVTKEDYEALFSVYKKTKKVKSDEK